MCGIVREVLIVCRVYHLAATILLIAILHYTVSVLGRLEGYTVKYTPPPEGVSEGEARGNS